MWQLWQNKASYLYIILHHSIPFGTRQILRVMTQQVQNIHFLEQYEHVNSKTAMQTWGPYILQLTVPFCKIQCKLTGTTIVLCWHHWRLLNILPYCLPLLDSKNFWDTAELGCLLSTSQQCMSLYQKHACVQCTLFWRISGAHCCENPSRMTQCIVIYWAPLSAWVVLLISNFY